MARMMRPKAGPLVVIVSPYSGDVEANVAYARECMRESLKRGEEPYAQHLLLPQVLDDTVPGERSRGMEVGWAWMERADLVAVYVNKGISDGMMQDIQAASQMKKEIEFRELPPPFVLTDEHLDLLRTIDNSGTYYVPADRRSVQPKTLRSLYAEGYVFSKDRLQQIVELTPKGKAAIGA